jgi:branched-chain amino acid transport system permease protein
MGTQPSPEMSSQPRESFAEVIRFCSTPMILVGGLALCVYLAPAISSSLEPTVITMLIDLVAVIGLFIFIGNSGVLSFGHISFMAIGAYTYALLTIPTSSKAIFLPRLPEFLAHSQMSAVPAALLAGVVAAAFGLVIAIPLMRLSGIAASIATFAVLVIVQVVLSNWDSLTNGKTPIIGVPNTTTKWSSFTWAAIFLVVAYGFKESGIGLRLRASREDLVAARALGVGIYVERVLAMVLSAFCVGVAGALFAGFLGSFSPDAFYVDLTIITLAMLVVGGMQTLTGAWLGTIAISALTETLRRFTEGVNLASLHVTAPSGTTQVGLGLAMLLVLILRPAGLVGGREVRLPRNLPPPPFMRTRSRGGRQAVLTTTDRASES